MNGDFPTKCWYVAATSSELTDAPLGRRLLGRDVVLWRGSGGGVAAQDDRCAHRAFPLSHGRIDGDRLVCGYHGCTYDPGGRCVHVPSQPRVPTGMRIAAFPVREEPPFVWVWLGPPSEAAGKQPPRVPWINDPDWTTFGSTWTVAANYLMAHEHYLDFSYAPVVHGSDLPPGLDRMPAFNDVEVTETSVAYTRLLPAAPPAGWEADATGLDPAQPYVRREMGTFVSPALHRQRWDIETASGAVYSTTRAHAITPQTSSSSHIFMQSSRNYALADSKVTSRLETFLAEVCRRDTTVLEMAFRHSGYDGWRSGVEFQADAAVIRLRRIVAGMLAREAGRVRRRTADDRRAAVGTARATH